MNPYQICWLLDWNRFHILFILKLHIEICVRMYVCSIFITVLVSVHECVCVWNEFIISWCNPLPNVKLVAIQISWYHSRLPGLFYITFDTWTNIHARVSIPDLNALIKLTDVLSCAITMICVIIGTVLYINIDTSYESHLT